MNLQIFGGRNRLLGICETGNGRAVHENVLIGVIAADEAIPGPAREPFD